MWQKRPVEKERGGRALPKQLSLSSFRSLTQNALWNVYDARRNGGLMVLTRKVHVDDNILAAVDHDRLHDWQVYWANVPVLFYILRTGFRRTARLQSRMYCYLHLNILHRRTHSLRWAIDYGDNACEARGKMICPWNVRYSKFWS